MYIHPILLNLRRKIRLNKLIDLKKLLTLNLLLCLSCLLSFAQDDNTFTYNDFLKTLLSNHPVVKQANLLRVRAEKTEQKARGAFDPKVEVNTDTKSFDSKDYYELTSGVLKVPTWFGVELKGGYENNSGLFLNPENYLPNSGLLYAGLSLPIGQGLFIDERRATLRKAQIYYDLTEAERKNLINQLVYDASVAYWKWFENWNKARIYEDVINASQQRLDALKLQVDAGDVPPIDTVEAGLQLINLQVGSATAEMEERKTKLYLSTFLWTEEGIPLEVSENAQALPWREFEQNSTEINLDSIGVGIERLSETHPLLQLFDYQKQTLEIEERLNREMLKPQLNLNYYPLSTPDELQNLATNNYKWGLNFSMPIFLRKERASLQLTKIKIQEIEYKLQVKNLELQNKVRASLIEYETTRNQASRLSDAIGGYETLLLAEREMFNIGESSIFVVNSREQYWLNSQLKLVELLSKNNRSLAELNYNLAIIEPENDTD